MNLSKEQSKIQIFTRMQNFFEGTKKVFMYQKIYVNFEKHVRKAFGRINNSHCLLYEYYRYDNER